MTALACALNFPKCSDDKTPLPPCREECEGIHKHSAIAHCLWSKSSDHYVAMALNGYFYDELMIVVSFNATVFKHQMKKQFT